MGAGRRRSRFFVRPHCSRGRHRRGAGARRRPDVRGAARVLHPGGIDPAAIATGRDGSVLLFGLSGSLYTQRFPNASLVPDPPINTPADIFLRLCGHRARARWVRAGLDRRSRRGTLQRGQHDHRATPFPERCAARYGLAGRYADASLPARSRYRPARRRIRGRVEARREHGAPSLRFHRCAERSPPRRPHRGGVAHGKDAHRRRPRRLPHGLGRRRGHRGAALRHGDAAANAALHGRDELPGHGARREPGRDARRDRRRAALGRSPVGRSAPPLLPPRRVVLERRHRRRLRHRGQSAGRDRRQRKLPRRLGQPALGARIRSQRNIARRRRPAHGPQRRQSAARRASRCGLLPRVARQDSALREARCRACARSAPPARRPAATGRCVPTCEVCDAGAANSDTTPDACRTDVPAARAAATA